MQASVVHEPRRHPNLDPKSWRRSPPRCTRYRHWSDLFPHHGQSAPCQSRTSSFNPHSPNLGGAVQSNTFFAHCRANPASLPALSSATPSEKCSAIKRKMLCNCGHSSSIRKTPLELGFYCRIGPGYLILSLFCGSRSGSDVRENRSFRAHEQRRLPSFLGAAYESDQLS